MPREKHPSFHSARIQEALLASRYQIMMAAFSTEAQLNEFRRQLYACRRAHKIWKTEEYKTLANFSSRTHDTGEMKRIRPEYEIDENLYPLTLVFTSQTSAERVKKKVEKPSMEGVKIFGEMIKEEGKPPQPSYQEPAPSTPQPNEDEDVMDLLDIISSLTNEDTSSSEDLF